MTLLWNLVTKNMHPHEQLQGKLRDKITKLERHLQHFPPDAVHLQVALDRNARKGLFTAALTLRIPSNLLRSTKSAADPIPALDQAVKALLRELGSFKSELRREALWKRKARREELHAQKPMRFAERPLPPGKGPQTLAELARQMVEENYERLLYFVRRQIWLAETEVVIPRDAIDAEAVADEVVRQAMSRPEAKPGNQNYRLWLYSLARRELEKRFRDLRERAVRSVSVEADVDIPNTVSQTEGVAADQRVSVLGERLDPVEIEARDFLPDAHTVSPDAALSDSDLVDYFHQAARNWPVEERKVFELYFLEGFELDEIAMLEKIKLSQAQECVEQVQSRLREVLAEAMEAKVVRPRKSA